MKTKGLSKLNPLSKMSIKEGQDQRITDSTRFLLRGVNLLKPELMQYGFINAFLDDATHEHHYENSIYLLFQPPDLGIFEWFVQGEKIRTHLLMEEYDYPKGFVVLVYKFPAEYMDDYRLFLKGKYSSFSDKYKSLFPMEKKGTTNKGLPYTEPSFFSHIFTKSKEMREFWERRVGQELEEKSDVWSIPNIVKETLNIKNYD